MRTTTLRWAGAWGALGLASAVLTGCGRDTRVNSDPGPGRPSAADSGERTVRPDPNAATPAAPGASGVGTNSVGRPSDASGGTVGAGAGSETSGTQTTTQPADLPSAK